MQYWRTSYGLSVVHVPKVACTSIKSALMASEGLDVPEQIEEIHRARTLHPVKSSGDDYVAAFVRNPFDRIHSAWKNKLHEPHRRETSLQSFDAFWRGMSFPAFVKRLHKVDLTQDMHITPQSQLIPKGINFLGHFESMDEDWTKLRERFTELPPLPHLNRATKGLWRKRVTPDLAEIITDLYAEDFERFGYGSTLNENQA